jgi:hypothetical protein
MKSGIRQAAFSACLLVSFVSLFAAYSSASATESGKKSSGSGQVAKPESGTIKPAEGTTTGAIRGRPASGDERWEVKPNDKLKAGTGRITVTVPGKGKLIFLVVPMGGRKQGEKFMSAYGSGSGNFKPGQYDVLLWDSRITVPVEAGADTRVKVGILSTEGITGRYKVYAEAGANEVYSGSTGGERVVLAAGRYRVRTMSGTEDTVTIRDGEVTNVAMGGLAGAQTADSTVPISKPTPQPPISTTETQVMKPPAGLPDLIPVSDGGKKKKFQSRWEWRHAFWVKNAGTSTSRRSQIRLKFYYMDVTVWKQHAELFLDVPQLQPGEESRALVTRLLYREMYLWDVPSGEVHKQHEMKGYKWEFWVDSTNVVPESNEQNNHLGMEATYPHHGALETGPSGSFH